MYHIRGILKVEVGSPPEFCDDEIDGVQKPQTKAGSFEEYRRA